MSKRPNYLGTFPCDLKEARRLLGGEPSGWPTAREKAVLHRKFRRLEHQLLRRGVEPPTRMSHEWYC